MWTTIPNLPGYLLPPRLGTGFNPIEKPIETSNWNLSRQQRSKADHLNIFSLLTYLVKILWAISVNNHEVVKNLFVIWGKLHRAHITKLFFFCSVYLGGSEPLGRSISLTTGFFDRDVFFKLLIFCLKNKDFL